MQRLTRKLVSRAHMSKQSNSNKAQSNVDYTIPRKLPTPPTPILTKSALTHPRIEFHSDAEEYALQTQSRELPIWQFIDSFVYIIDAEAKSCLEQQQPPPSMPHNSRIQHRAPKMTRNADVDGCRGETAHFRSLSLSLSHTHSGRSSSLGKSDKFG